MTPLFTEKDFQNRYGSSVEASVAANRANEKTETLQKELRYLQEMVRIARIDLGRVSEILLDINTKDSTKPEYVK